MLANRGGKIKIKFKITAKILTHPPGASRQNTLEKKIDAPASAIYRSTENSNYVIY